MKLSDTIAHLSAIRTGMAQSPASGSADRLRDLTNFGSNPGNLGAKVYLPAAIEQPSALVVVLHGCSQTAAGYDHGAGWSALADEQGFALLFPEQGRANNPNLCFNWFSPEDTARDSGEALSIRQMIGAMVDAHGIDPARIFITGLSAGGAMTSVMLATYPELFAGGAIIAGLPYGAGGNLSKALEAMRGQGLPRPAELAALVRRASPHTGRWPTLSIWQGTADSVVNQANAEAILAQWLPIQGLPADPSEQESVKGHSRRLWRDASGRTVIEDVRIAGMGHGTPIAAKGEGACGVAGPYMLDVGLSSTRAIAAGWGLTGAPRSKPAPEPAFVETARPIRPERMQESAPAAPKPAAGVQKVIEDALRTAGLMR
jgi:poly(hydroxyalkanoate) depolymerase family esterase